MRRLKIKDIAEQDIRRLTAEGYRASVYRAGNGTVVEVSFVKRNGPEPWRVRGCSYMSDQWAPSALAKIAAMARARPKRSLAQRIAGRRGVSS